MKSAQQGTFSCQNAVFLVNWLVLYQGRGLAAFHTGRDICSQESLHLYLARWKWQYLPLCSASSTSVSRGQEALSAITQCTQKFSSELQSFRNSLWMFFIFLLLYPTHPIWVVLGLGTLCVCTHVCECVLIIYAARPQERNCICATSL